MNILNKRFLLACAPLFLLLAMCKTDSSDTRTPAPTKPRVKIPTFDADSAYTYVDTQVGFGPRVPGTDAHKQCKNWLVAKFEEFGADVISQDFNAKIYTGDIWSSSNVIAQINKDHKSRILLSAHWDSRFMSEEDESEKDQPTLGADDGGSGVGVLLEIARLLNENPIDLGVDIILWDAEDQGKRGDDPGNTNTWGLGSQYWSKNQHKKNYRAMYMINLDMVGANKPTFHKEYWSMQYAAQTVDKIWTLAGRMGYSDMFVDRQFGGVTDDHYFVNTLTKIPALDIINQPFSEKGGFQKCWHKKCDDMSGINKRSLQVVGQVVTAVLYKESDGTF